MQHDEALEIVGRLGGENRVRRAGMKRARLVGWHLGFPDPLGRGGLQGLARAGAWLTDPGGFILQFAFACGYIGVRNETISAYEAFQAGDGERFVGRYSPQPSLGHLLQRALSFSRTERIEAEGFVYDLAARIEPVLPGLAAAQATFELYRTDDARIHDRHPPGGCDHARSVTKAPKPSRWPSASFRGRRRPGSSSTGSRTASVRWPPPWAADPVASAAGSQPTIPPGIARPADRTRPWPSRRSTPRRGAR